MQRFDLSDAEWTQTPPLVHVRTGCKAWGCICTLVPHIPERAETERPRSRYRSRGSLGALRGTVLSSRGEAASRTRGVKREESIVYSVLRGAPGLLPTRHFSIPPHDARRIRLYTKYFKKEHASRPAGACLRVCVRTVCGCVLKQGVGEKVCGSAWGTASKHMPAVEHGMHSGQESSGLRLRLQ